MVNTVLDPPNAPDLQESVSRLEFGLGDLTEELFIKIFTMQCTCYVETSNGVFR